jgi:hypothetical protein
VARGRGHPRDRTVRRAQDQLASWRRHGLRDPELMQTTTFVVANSITLILDLVVVALAWVLAFGPRRRLLVVLAPLVWGATGLMVTPVLSAAVLAVTGGPSDERLAGANQPGPCRRRISWDAGRSGISATGERNRPGVVRSGRVRGSAARVVAGHGLLCLAGRWGQ